MGIVVNRILVCYYQNIVAKKPNFVIKSINVLWQTIYFFKTAEKMFLKN